MHSQVEAAVTMERSNQTPMTRPAQQPPSYPRRSASRTGEVFVWLGRPELSSVGMMRLKKSWALGDSPAQIARVAGQFAEAASVSSEQRTALG